MMIFQLYFTLNFSKSHGININAVKIIQRVTQSSCYIPEIDKSYLMYLLHFDILVLYIFILL